MPFFVQVYNTTAHEQVSFEKINPKTLTEALEYREQVKREYEQIGCHEVKLLVELFPDEELEED